MDVARKVGRPRYRKVPREAAGLAELFGRDPLLLQVAPIPPETFLANLEDLARTKALHSDGDWGLNRRGQVAASRPGAAVFDGRHVVAAAVYLPYLFLNLPVGHPLRAKLPVFLDLVRARLRNPRLLLPLEPLDLLFAPGAPGALLDRLGGRVWMPAGYRGSVAREVGRDSGEIVALVLEGGMYLRLAYRPARVDWSRPPGLFAGKLPLPDRRAFGPVLAETLRTDLPVAPPSPACVRLLLSRGFTALAERVVRTPVPAGGWEANPLLSVPELVGVVRKARRLSEDAAVLYLQTLALLEPTRQRVRGWNGWNLERYLAAAGELARRGLVLEDRRPRAGRAHFLPGAWIRPRRGRRKGERLRADRPFEAWKLPSYQLELRRREFGPLSRRERILRPLGLLLPLEPLQRIFEGAWRRVESGGGPDRG